MRFDRPKTYGSIAEFEREELKSGHKAGWSLDDLFAEADFNPGLDDSIQDDSPEELDFDF